MAASKPSADQLITENINVWTSAIKKRNSQGRGSSKKIELYGIKKMRELILELAVRGLLVPQNANDEPASVLLENIAVKKEQLIKDGKLKEKKPLPEISEKEKPFELPKGWEWARLNDIGLIASSRRVQKKDWVDNGVPFYRAREIVKLSRDGFVGDDLFITEAMYAELSERGETPECNDIMITGVGTIGVPYKVKSSDEFYFKDASVLIFKNYYSISPDYLCLFMKTPYWNKTIHSKSMGTTVHTLTISRANDVLIPIIPQAEVSKVVAKVNELMALCDQLEQQTESSLTAHQTLVETLLNTLLTAAQTTGIKESSFEQAWNRIAQNFDILFTTNQSLVYLESTLLELAANGGLIKFGEGAEVLNVSDLLSFGPKNGFSPKSVDFETPIKTLKLGATTKGILDLSESKFVDVNVEEDSHLWLKRGDILLQRGNSADYVGCNLLIVDDAGPYIYPDLMMKLRVNEKVTPEFLSLVLSSPGCRQQMWDKMTGTSGTMPKINKKNVESVKVIVPSIEIQNRVVEKNNQLRELCRLLKISIDHAQLTQIDIAETIVKEAVT